MNTTPFNTNSTLSSVQQDEAFKKAEQIINDNNNLKTEKKSKGLIVILFVVIFLLILLAFSTIFALLTINSDKVIFGVSVLGIDISGLSIEDAKAKLSNEFNTRLNSNLVFCHNEQLFNVMPSQLECNFDIDDAVNTAYSYGRGDNIFINNFNILNTWVNNIDIFPNFTYSDDLYNSMVEQMNSQFEDGLKDYSYTIENNNLIITNGCSGSVIISDLLKKYIIEKVTATVFNTDSINVPIELKDPGNIDIEKIYKEVYKAPVDAYYTKEPFVVYPSVTGIDFQISLDEAKTLISTPAESYTIPLKTLYPKVTTNDIGTEAFPDKLSTFSTSYVTSDYNRSTNIALAASKINGTVLMPGEEFSFNGTVGKRTPGAGFRQAGVYVNGGSAIDYGGGICQVSSTLYNAVLKANLDISSRSNHMFTVGYVPIGLDATVSWGAPDFKFKNSRKYPIKIVATTSNKKLYISVYGLKEDVEYEVELISYKTGSVPFSTVYTTDSSLEKGKTKVVQAGSNGAKAVSYKVLKLDGKEISRTLLAKDTYSPHNQIIARGTK